MKNIFLLGLSLFLLSACAVPMKSQEMMPQFDFYDSVKSKKFEDNIYVRNIEVAKGVGGMSPVTPEEYRAALVSAFRQADLYAPEGEAKYALDAVMTEMKQPAFGFNLTATASANYTLEQALNGKTVFSQTVAVPCTKGVGDAFDAAIRLRLASGCAVGENITHLIKVIVND